MIRIVLGGVNAWLVIRERWMKATAEAGFANVMRKAARAAAPLRLTPPSLRRTTRAANEHAF